MRKKLLEMGILVVPAVVPLQDGRYLVARYGEARCPSTLYITIFPFLDIWVTTSCMQGGRYQLFNYEKTGKLPAELPVVWRDSILPTAQGKHVDFIECSETEYDSPRS
jgi:hypothetical protein